MRLSWETFEGLKQALIYIPMTYLKYDMKTLNKLSRSKTAYYKIKNIYIYIMYLLTCVFTIFSRNFYVKWD